MAAGRRQAAAATAARVSDGARRPRSPLTDSRGVSGEAGGEQRRTGPRAKGDRAQRGQPGSLMATDVCSAAVSSAGSARRRRHRPELHGDQLAAATAGLSEFGAGWRPTCMREVRSIRTATRMSQSSPCSRSWEAHCALRSCVNSAWAAGNACWPGAAAAAHQPWTVPATSRGRLEAERGSESLALACGSGMKCTALSEEGAPA